MSAEEADPTGALAAREIVSTRVVGAARDLAFKAKGLPVELTVFPGTTHAFDHSTGDKPVVTKMGSLTVTYRYNPESVETTWKLTLDFLARRLGGAGTR